VLDVTSFFPPIIGAIIGILLKYVYDRYAENRKFKKELEDNDFIDVTGEWYAAWQTSIDGKENLNTEHIKIIQKGKTLRLFNTEIAPDNPKGGYRWEGQLQFFQGRSVMGWYFPKEGENNASRGILYMTHISQKKIFIGKWVGTAYDGELVSGFVVIGKDRTSSLEELKDFIKEHPQDIQLISYKY
jgi:hypothetical protein